MNSSLSQPGELDRTHETLLTLKRLAPEACVCGGSFAGWLPHPGTLAASARAAVFASARHDAVIRCIQSLLWNGGLDGNSPVEAGAGGDRQWPAGFVGSLTHKGTVVLGVIAPTSAVQLIGIDLERVDRDDLADIQTTIAANEILPGLEPELARLLTFSAKEAVFKAQYPITRQRLSFSDVQLVWEPSGTETIRAAIHCPLKGLELRASVVGQWIVSLAISTARTGS